MKLRKRSAFHFDEDDILYVLKCERNEKKKLLGGTSPSNVSFAEEVKSLAIYIGKNRNVSNK